MKRSGGKKRLRQLSVLLAAIFCLNGCCNQRPESAAASCDYKTFYRSLAAEERSGDSCTGTITYISKIPDPAAMDYPDCLVALEVELHSAQKTVKANLFLPVVANKIALKRPPIAVGGSLRFTLVPWENAPEPWRNCQVSDSVPDVTLPIFFVTRCEEGNAKDNDAMKFGKTNMRQGAAETISPLPDSPPTAPEAANRREKRREEELALLTRKINEFEKARKIDPEAFVQFCRSVQSHFPNNSAHAVLSGGDIFSISGFTPKVWEQNLSENYHPSVLAAILDIRDYLRRFNIDLIVVPAPLSYELCLKEFIPEAANYPILNLPRLMLIRDLLANGVEAVDLLPALQEAQRNGERQLFKYAFLDVHFSSRGAKVAADELTRRLKDYPVIKEGADLSPEKIAAQISRVPNTYKISSRLSEYAGKELEFMEYVFSPDHTDTKNSAYFLMGDSFVRGGGLTSALGCNLMQFPSSFSRNAGATQQMRLLLQIPPERLAGNRVGVLVFHPSNLTQAWEYGILDLKKQFASLPAGERIRPKELKQVQNTSGKLILADNQNNPRGLLQLQAANQSRAQLNFQMEPEKALDKTCEYLIRFQIHTSQASVLMELDGEKKTACEDSFEFIWKTRGETSFSVAAYCSFYAPDANFSLVEIEIKPIKKQ